MSRHASQMDAAGYWRQFPVTAHFLEPMEITGILIDLGEHRARDEVIPKLRIQQDDGTIVIVIAGQTRLQAELVKYGPAVGDHITITYTGESSRAAPGMNRTKEFTVVVRRPKKNEPDSVARTIAKAAGDLEARLEHLTEEQHETIKHFRRAEGLTRPLRSLEPDDRVRISAELDRRGWATPTPATPDQPSEVAEHVDVATLDQYSDEPF